MYKELHTLVSVLLLCDIFFMLTHATHLCHKYF